MCDLCSINHFTDDEYDDEYEYDVSPSLCVYAQNHVNTTWQTDLNEQTFRPVSAGSSF